MMVLCATTISENEINTSARPRIIHKRGCLREGATSTRI